MITLTFSEATAWLIACTVSANFVLGIYHLLIVLETIRTRPMPILTAILLGTGYAGPPAMLMIALGKATNII